MAPVPHVDGDPFGGLVRSRQRGPLPGGQEGSGYPPITTAEWSGRAPQQIGPGRDSHDLAIVPSRRSPS